MKVPKYRAKNTMGEIVCGYPVEYGNNVIIIDEDGDFESKEWHFVDPDTLEEVKE